MASLERSVEIRRRGPQALVQDLGRPGYAHLGVGRSGAADRNSLKLANRLVGNHRNVACIEVVLGGLEIEFNHSSWVAVTGAPLTVRVGTRNAWTCETLFVRAGEVLALGTPEAGLRSYIALRGGIATEPVLGSRATDTMSGLGPAPIEIGDVLPVDVSELPIPSVDCVPYPYFGDETVFLEAESGPRHDWFENDALDLLYASTFEVTSDANRVGVRLDGPALPRVDDRELLSEGVVCGSLQAPPEGRLTLFLADHPVTGGYPVIAVVSSRFLSLAAQLRPGQKVRFTPPSRVQLSG